MNNGDTETMHLDEIRLEHLQVVYTVSTAIYIGFSIFRLIGTLFLSALIARKIPRTFHTTTRKEQRLMLSLH